MLEILHLNIVKDNEITIVFGIQLNVNDTILITP